jgi:Family of unknown function (DUF5764)
MESSKQSILTDAKNQYIQTLVEEISPEVIHIFNDMYNPKEGLLEFQKKLKDIQRWSDVTTKQYTDSIINKCPFFEDLLTAIFATIVRIMTTYRLTSNTPDVNVKIPKNTVFIHSLLISVAHKFYANPYIFKERNSEYKKEVVRTAIDSTIRKLLPVREILDAYLGNSVNNGQLTEEIFDKGFEEPFEDNDPTPAEEEKGTLEAEEEAEEEVEAEEKSTEDDIKTIPIGPQPAPESAEAEEAEAPTEPKSFFDDAGSLDE